MTVVATYEPTDYIAGDKQITTDAVTVLSGENLAALTVVQYDADGKIVTHPGTATPVAGVLIHAVDASTADAPGIMYATGCFFADALVWHATQSTALLQKLLVSGSGIQVKSTTAGE